ncbi:ATP-dependent nuclease [Massilicoli timonensis]|uniref:ATP-dependent nuclease n=1 Tax=Massilicoli timonensis TaxID=2015901 RepID=UPI000C850B33|nr:AAA family ATPase [Massilicoli timonensis]
MIVSKLELYNFRQFKSNGDLPGLSISFHKGLNALIGENDSGKTAIIDALKIVLLTQSNEYVRPTDEDFYTDEDGNVVKEFCIKCTINDFTQNEAKNFVEYLCFEKNGDTIKYSMNLHYRAWKDKNRIYSELRVGNIDDNIILDGKAKELLRTVYLKPLRDAEREMSSGRNSRLAQILSGHSLFVNKEEHRLKEILSKANEDIEKYFTEEEGKEVLETIRNNLSAFNVSNTSSEAQLKVADIQLKKILESLSLRVSEVNPGLGELNLLFIAAELLLLNADSSGGLRLALIEELEAHLHPQAQLRLIDYLQKEYDNSGTQIIISTHSTILASKVNLKNIVLLKNGIGYDMTYGNTELEKGDYLFLQRFLDATKANLFFARGVLMVEGDAENLLLPVLAEVLDYPLEKYGVSIVNVGSTAFLRYSRIFVRKNGDKIDIPVSVVTDCDVKPYDIDPITKEKKFNEKVNESELVEKEKNKKYTSGSVCGFTSPRWTLEYCIALSCLQEKFHKAIRYGKKIKNSDKYALTEDKIEEVKKEITEDNDKWKGLSHSEKAFEMYRLMLNESDKSGLKAIVAQCLVALIKLDISILPEGFTEVDMFDLDLYQSNIDETKKKELSDNILTDPYLKYLVDAIKYSVNFEN